MMIAQGVEISSGRLSQLLRIIMQQHGKQGRAARELEQSVTARAKGENDPNPATDRTRYVFLNYISVTYP